MLLVRATSPGPGLIRQKRIGQGGKVFTLYKIRTMFADAEARTGAVWSRPGDPRVTVVGRILRRLHLDELPQLVNVLKGEMSLVGPRPERPELVPILSKAVPGYTDRHQVPPGITGLAQLSLPPDTDLDSVRRKLVHRRVLVHSDQRCRACTFAFAAGWLWLRLRSAPRPCPCNDFSACADTSAHAAGIQDLILGTLPTHLS